MIWNRESEIVSVEADSLLLEFFGEFAIGLLKAVVWAQDPMEKEVRYGLVYM
jgi:hypothetical protein